MNAQAFRIYAYLLVKANPVGKNKGHHCVSIGQLASDLKMHRITMQKIINKDLKGKYISITPGKNQHAQTDFLILKYKTVADFACSEKTTTKATSSEQPRLQAVNKQVTSTVENSSNNTGLQAPNKLRSKEGNNSINKTILSFWNKHKIIQHKPSKKISEQITTSLKTYTVDEIKEAISNYSQIMKSPNHWLKHPWTLVTFLKQQEKNSIETFLNINNPLERYKGYANAQNRQNNKKPDQPKRETYADQRFCYPKDE
jgi:hypothetical protein